MAPLTRQASRCKRRRESVRFEGTMRESAPGRERTSGSGRFRPIGEFGLFNWCPL